MLNTYYLTFKYSEIYSKSEYMVNVIVELKLQPQQSNDRITVTEYLFLSQWLNRKEVFDVV